MSDADFYRALERAVRDPRFAFKVDEDVARFFWDVATTNSPEISNSSIEDQARALLAAEYGDDPVMAGMIRRGDFRSEETRRGVRAVIAALRTSAPQEPVAWLRDLDGTGSLHAAAKGDPGAFPVVPAPGWSAPCSECWGRGMTNEGERCTTCRGAT